VAELPEHLQRRAAEARAKAEGRPIDGAAAAPPADAALASAAPQNGGGPGRDLDADASTFGVPRPLLERAMFARAKSDGSPVPQLVGAGAPAAAAGSAAPPVSSAPPAAPSGPPPGVRTQRLLTVVKAGAIQGTTKEPADKVNVWPHLLAIEFVALLAMLAFLTLLSAFVDAPLLEFANFNAQPNPSKAPWYFLGLQELLAYFDPMVAGVIIPGFGLAALAFIPYIDRNPSVRPSDRKLAISIFTVFFMAAAVLTIFGSFFRGPGFNFTFPWRDGIFFDDLLTILE
jgi:menaquinol-cytochrome c reductase cytochrome b/c subunit